MTAPGFTSPGKPPVHVICATNASYVMPLCVMLASLVDNFDRERDLVVHVFSNDATSKEKDAVLDSLGMIRPGLDHITVEWLSVDSPLMEKFPALGGGYITRDTYFRLFAPYLLPHCDRALYLDCDMVILADVSRLYDETADSPALLHAAHELAAPLASSEQGIFDYAERGIPPETRCFNAGVMVLNLKRWREQDVSPAIIDYLLQNSGRINWGDQGAMNAFLYREWVPLDPRWNQPSAVVSESLWTACGYTRQDWLRIKNDPYIVHYTGSVKPWTAGRRHAPRRIYFYRYIQKTVFRNTVPRYPHLEGVLGFHAYYNLWKSAGRGFRMLAGALPLPSASIARLREKF